MILILFIKISYKLLGDFMSIIKKYLVSIVITLLAAIVLSFFINILNYFDILNNSFYKALLIIFSIISVFAGSYFLGNNSNNKGYLNGIIFGIVIILVFILLSFIFTNTLSASSIIYYLILIINSSIAGVIGINKSKNESKSS